jgi:hypothetical protein
MHPTSDLARDHIGHLQIRSGISDAGAVRRSVERQLAAVDLRPPGLPPSAVLLVRRMEDPRPGSLGVGGFRPPASWGRAVRERLGDAVRRAARPDRRGRLPADAPAVLFADPAELLACRLCGIAAGEPEPWWASRLPMDLGGPAASARDPVALLSKKIRELPAVFQRLAEWGAVTPVLRSLNEPEATRLLKELVREWSLPAALAGHRTSSDAATEKLRVKRRALEDEPVAPRRGGEPRGQAVEHEVDPWADWLPPEVATASLAPAVRAVAGVAFGLLRSPALLRSPDLAERVAEWWRRVEAKEPRDPEPSTPPAAEPRPVPEAHDSPRPRSEITETSRFRENASSPADPSAESLALGDANYKDSELRGETAAGADPEPASSDPLYPELFDRPAVGSPAEQRSAQASTRVDGEAPEEVPTPDSRDLFTQPGDTCLTAWGGVFYLIHLLEEQGLPRAAEDDWRLETVAGPWGTLDLVARGLLAHRFPETADDPVWRLLEHLAAWPDDRDGDGANETPHEPLYPLPAGCPPHLGVWLASALPALRDRLLLALDEDAADDEATAAATDPIERLLAVPARIHVTSSHLDVVTGLDRIWLPARRTGLDRNPGWLPGYGRVVLFHFEELGAAS